MEMQGFFFSWQRHCTFNNDMPGWNSTGMVFPSIERNDAIKDGEKAIVVLPVMNELIMA